MGVHRLQYRYRFLCLVFVLGAVPFVAKCSTHLSCLGSIQICMRIHYTGAQWFFGNVGSFCLNPVEIIAENVIIESVEYASQGLFNTDKAADQSRRTSDSSSIVLYYFR